MNSTISHSSSTSGASTSPPATPPDNASDLVAPPAVYTHSDASMSSTTLQSQLDVHVEPDHSAPPRRKKLSLFNAKMNASTDNISISSTMSSASQVLRKIGTFGGKLSKRSSLASIGSMFHKDKAARDADDAQSEFGVSTTPTSRLRKGLKRPKGHPSAASVSLATAEQEAPPTNGGLTPAAQLAKEQQDRYAEQEAKEKESERAQTASPAPSTEDRRLKLLEKEKNKLNKKSRKLWGKGSFGGNQSVGYSKESAEVATSSSPVDEFGHPTASEEDNESLTRHDDYASLHTQSLPMPAVSGSLFEETLSSLEDRTPRQSTDASAVASTSGSALRSVFEDDTNSLTQPFHAAPSTNSVNESGSEYESSLYRGYQPGREPTPPMPSKAAPRPLRGILKRAFHFTSIPLHGSC